MKKFVNFFKKINKTMNNIADVPLTVAIPVDHSDSTRNQYVHKDVSTHHFSVR